MPGHPAGFPRGFPPVSQSGTTAIDRRDPPAAGPTGPRGGRLDFSPCLSLSSRPRRVRGGARPVRGRPPPLAGGPSGGGPHRPPPADPPPAPAHPPPSPPPTPP